MAPLALAGRDVREFGCRVVRMPGLEDAPARKPLTYQVRQAFGAHLVKVEAGGPRTLPIELALIRDSVAARIAAADALKALCTGLVRIERDFGGSIRLTYGTLEGTPTFTTERFGRARVTMVRLSFLCYPLWRKPTTWISGYAGSARAHLPFETGPVPWEFEVNGNGSSRYFRVYDAWGNQRVQIGLPALDANDSILILASRGLIWKYDGTTRSTIYGSCAIEMGAFPFTIDPSWGDRELGLYPSFDVSGSYPAEARGILTFQ